MADWRDRGGDVVKVEIGSRESGIGAGHGSARVVSPALPNSLFLLPCFRRASRADGFSLLEVIAAVLLLAITFAALMRVAGSSLNLTTRAAERSEAAMWARSLLDSAYVLEPARVGASSGRFDARYQWQLNVSPWQPATAGAQGPVASPLVTPATLHMFRLDLDVLWAAGGHHYSAHFSTLRLATPPEQPPPGAGP